MGEHCKTRTAFKGDGYKARQALRASETLLADSRRIRDEGLILRRTPKGTDLVRRQPARAWMP